MKVDLVVPRFPPAHWNFAFAMDLEGSAYSHPPLGAATLAAYTPDDVELRIVDENVAPLEIERLAPVVGISAMYVQRKRALELAAVIRSTGRRVAIGGGITSALPEACRGVADSVFFGEGEQTWPRFIEDARAGQVQPEYRAPGFHDLTRAARAPRLDLLDMKAYSTGSIQTSRGCPYSCDYCDVPLIDGPRTRRKPVELVMQEVHAWHRAGHSSIFFVDDHFLGDRKSALALLDELESFVRGVDYKVLFYCQATLNVARDDEMLDRLYRANFRRLFIGIESNDPVALRSANKPQNATIDVTSAVRRIQEHNITVWAALLAGFDCDDAGVFDRYLAFVREASIGMIVPGLLQAVPGTAYHRRVVEQQRLVPLRNGYAGGQAGSLDTLLSTNVAPVNMSRDELIKGYRRFVRELYEYDAYAERVIGFLNAGKLPELGRPDAQSFWAARGVLGRMIRHYLFGGDGERRAFFLRVMRHLLRSGLRRVDEAVFHLVVYKHLREFYFSAADASTPLADDVEPVGVGLAALA